MGCSVATMRIWAVMKTSAHVCDPVCRDNRVYAFYMFLNFPTDTTGWVAAVSVSDAVWKTASSPLLSSCCHDTVLLCVSGRAVHV